MKTKFDIGDKVSFYCGSAGTTLGNKEMGIVDNIEITNSSTIRYHLKGIIGDFLEGQLEIVKDPIDCETNNEVRKSSDLQPKEEIIVKVRRLKKREICSCSLDLQPDYYDEIIEDIKKL